MFQPANERVLVSTEGLLLLSTAFPIAVFEAYSESSSIVRSSRSTDTIDK